jgi:hypothetical protein
MSSSQRQSAKRTEALLLEAERASWTKRKTEGAMQAQLAAAMRKIDQLEAAVAAHQEFDEIPARVLEYKPKSKNSKESSSVAIAMASDWHVEIMTSLELTNGVNETNPEIIQVRAERYFKHLLRMLEISRSSTNVTALCLPLLGDFIDNHLHEDSAEQVAMMPVQAAAFARDLLSAGIKRIIKEHPNLPIHIDCHTGNHGRTTKKVHVSSEHGHSYETMIYEWLKQELSSNTVDFRIPKSPLSYRKYWDYTIRMIHGHQIKYQGGIGGMTVPLNRMLAKWDQSISADCTLIGHFHSLIDHGRALVNGSLCGWTGYAQWIGASPEPPQQWFQLLTNFKGGRRTLRAPLMLDKE